MHSLFSSCALDLTVGLVAVAVTTQMLIVATINLIIAPDGPEVSSRRESGSAAIVGSQRSLAGFGLGGVPSGEEDKGGED